MGHAMDKKTIVFDATVSDRKILVVPVHTIFSTPYNPKNRTKEGKKLMTLVCEIQNRGMLYPILITRDRHVIDGNRRLAAARLLGMDTIECIVSDIDRDEAFSVVNTTAVPIGGKGWLEIGMGGGFLPPDLRSKYDELHSLVGTYGVKLMIDKGIGLNALALCKSVAALDSKYLLAELVMLCVDRKMTNKFNAIIRSDWDRKAKVDAVDLLLAGV